MTGARYRAMLDALTLTHAAAADFLGVHERTSRRYEHDEIAIPDAVARLLLLAKGLGGVRAAERIIRRALR